jgi:hypothetical protein
MFAELRRPVENHHNSLGRTCDVLGEIAIFIYIYNESRLQIRLWIPLREISGAIVEAFHTDSKALIHFRVAPNTSAAPYHRTHTL